MAKNPFKDYSKAYEEVEKKDKNKIKPQVFKEDKKEESDSKYGTYYMSKEKDGTSDCVMEIKKLEEDKEENSDMNSEEYEKGK